MLDRASVMACLPGSPRSSAARAAASRGGQTGEIGFAFENERIGLLVREHVLGELRPEGRQALGDGGDPRLRFGFEARACPREDGVIAIEHAGLLW